METKGRPTHRTAGGPSRRRGDRLLLRRMLMAFDVFPHIFYRHRNAHTEKTHTQDTQRAKAALLRPKSCPLLVDSLTSVLSLPPFLPPLPSVHLCLPLPGLSFPFSATLRLADLGAARTDQTQTGAGRRRRLFILCRRRRAGPKQARGNNP